MEFTRDVENHSVSIRIRKPYTGASLSSHSILTDDVFSYVDFFFKTHRRGREKQKKGVLDHTFYWEQSRNFYIASKNLPMESAPLPMYYCMLNAIKAYIVYSSKATYDVSKDFGHHGLGEGKCEGEDKISLCSIRINRCRYGVFSAFCKLLNSETMINWPYKDSGSVSAKELLYQLPFVHSAYVSTYKVPRKNEKFIPLQAGSSPTFRYDRSNRIRLVVDLDRHYFKGSAVCLPKEIEQSIPKGLIINPDNCFQLISERYFLKKEIDSVYNEYRTAFSYIAADKRLWYLNRSIDDLCDLGSVNTMIPTVALSHRFSEIVRYKPEQMVCLLQGKENWLIHEFLSNALDQFMDEIACEITKEEIMHTKKK